jgi:hypothetical protein
MHRCPSFVAAAGLVLAATALASPAPQTPLEAESPPQRTSSTAFVARNPGAWRIATRSITGEPSFVYGARIAMGGPQGSDDGWAAAARLLIDENRDLIGAGSEDLVLREIVPLELSRVGSSDKIAVVFDQVVDGIPAFGSVSLLFDARSGDALAIDTTAVPFARQRLAAAPAISASAAIDFAAAAFERRHGVRPQVDPAIVPRIVGPSPYFGAKSSLARRGATLTWQIDLAAPDLRDDAGLPIAMRAHVAADDGEVLALVTTVHAIDGQVQGNVNVGQEPNTPSNQETVPLKGLRVRQNGSGGTILGETAADGSFSLPQAGPLTLYFELAGPWVRVLNEGGAEASFTVAGATSGNPVVVLFNPTNAEFPTAEVAGFHWVTAFRDWVKAVSPSDTTMDFQVRTEVNKNDLICNAYYDGTAINMQRAGSEGGNVCVNTAYGDVIQHEEGHWANERYNGGALTGAFHEGNADIFAYFINDDPCLTSFISGGCLRTALQTTVKKCAVDGDETCNGGASHKEGQALASAAWAVRTRLIASLGAVAGDATGDALFLAWMQAFDDGAILEVIHDHWLALDDDDADLSNLTPNFGAIDGGFKEYGWKGFPDPSLTVTQSPADGAEVAHLKPSRVVLNATSLTGSVASITLHQSQDGVNFVASPMTPTGQADEFEGYLAGVPSPATVAWYVEAVSSGGSTARHPETAPENRRVFHVGDLVTLAAFDFEAAGDEGFTHVSLGGSFGDQWQRANPAGSEASTDPLAAYSGTRVWGTDLSTTGSDGMYEPNASGELRTPSFSFVSSPQVRMQYRRHLAVEKSEFDLATIRVNGAIVYTNPFATDRIDSEWVLHDLDITPQAAGNPAVTVAFRIAADGGLEYGGWNVDDLRFYRVDPTTALGTFNTYGTGCPGALGQVPALAGNGIPTPGQNVTLAITNGKSNGQGLLLLGTAAVALPMGGGCTLLAGGTLIPLPITLDGAGTLAIPGNIPPSTPTLDVYWQFLGADPQAPNGSFAASNGLAMHVE